MSEKASVAVGLVMPRRISEVDVPEYAGFKVTLWVNYPQRLAKDIGSGDTNRIAAALKAIVVAHNGWADDEGKVLPQPSEQAFWDEIPTELAGVILALLGQATTQLPNSVATRRSS